MDKNSSQIKYDLPKFLEGKIVRGAYTIWLTRKARSLRKRDRKRGYFLNYTNEKYKIKIHKAIIESKGKDYYTGEKIDWGKMGKYDNEQSKKDGRDYWKKIWDAPSVDHYDSSKNLVFKICTILTNDMKNHMDENEFIERCKKVVKWQRHK